MQRIFLRIVPAFAALLAVTAFGGRTPPRALVSRISQPIPVIYDTDVDIDDSAALAYLCEADRQGTIDLRAVTVDNNGFGTPRRALTHVRSILQQCGEAGVPVAEGSDTPGVHQAPAVAVQTVETVLTGALGDGSAPPVSAPLTAAQLIDQVIATSPVKVAVLTTGPLTNLAQALRLWRTTHPAQDGWLAGRIQALTVMGGAINVPGNLFGTALTGFDNSQEFNMWLDPVSAREVFRAMPPGVTHLVPLDATNAVPITQQYIDRIGADQHTPSARLVYTIMTQPAMAAIIKSGIYYWWDDLAAISAFRNGGVITDARDLPIDVVLDGPQSGRTVVTPDGTLQHVALQADQSIFEQTYLDALNGQ